MIVTTGTRARTAYSFKDGDKVEIRAGRYSAGISALRDDDNNAVIDVKTQFVDVEVIEEFIVFLQQVQKSLVAGNTTIELPVD